jgi:CheY-like chemotaxis protein
MAEQAEQLKSILVVDGDVIVRHAIADYLRDCGFVVIEASSTDEAVTVLGEESLAVHAVLCDGEAPGSLNAFEFRLWANRQQGRKGVEIALAGNIEAAASKAAELCDHGPHLARPYDPQSVVAYIRRMLGAAG